MFRCVSERIEKLVWPTCRKVKCHPMFPRSVACVCVGYDELPLFNSNLVDRAHCHRIVYQYLFKLKVVHFTNTALALSILSVSGKVAYISNVTLSGKAVANFSSRRQ